MTPLLARKLIDKGVIRKNTEIDAFYQGVDLSGTPMARVKGNFSIVEAKIIPNDLYFLAVDTIDGMQRKIWAKDVVLIDGMEPTRLANNYSISAIGDGIKEGKRRGRKPKAKAA